MRVTVVCVTVMRVTVMPVTIYMVFNGFNGITSGIQRFLTAVNV
jgi:hypothetical protein